MVARNYIDDRRRGRPAGAGGRGRRSATSLRRWSARCSSTRRSSARASAHRGPDRRRGQALRSTAPVRIPRRGPPEKLSDLLGQLLQIGKAGCARGILDLPNGAANGARARGLGADRNGVISGVAKARPIPGVGEDDPSRSPRRDRHARGRSPKQSADVLDIDDIERPRHAVATRRLRAALGFEPAFRGRLRETPREVAFADARRAARPRRDDRGPDV